MAQPVLTTRKTTIALPSQFTAGAYSQSSGWLVAWSSLRWAHAGEARPCRRSGKWRHAGRCIPSREDKDAAHDGGGLDARGGKGMGVVRKVCVPGRGSNLAVNEGEMRLARVVGAPSC